MEHFVFEGEADMLHEFRFSSHHPRQQISPIPELTDVLIWSLEQVSIQRVEGEHDNGHVAVLESGD